MYYLRGRQSKAGEGMVFSIPCKPLFIATLLGRGTARCLLESDCIRTLSPDAQLGSDERVQAVDQAIRCALTGF